MRGGPTRRTTYVRETSVLFGLWRELAVREDPDVVRHEFPGLWHDVALSVGQLVAADESALLVVADLARGVGWKMRIFTA